MCGIAGVFSLGLSEQYKTLVSAIVESQKPRGPDHQAIEKSRGRGSTCVLGHDRLSILDLSPGSHQPMWDADRRFCIVFNGEIYNYREIRQELERLGCSFRTTGDTEVLLEAFKQWRSAVFAKLNGMFAFAVWDVEGERLWLARDRFGVKPCFYHLTDSYLAFASSTLVIAHKFGLRPNLGYVLRGLRYWVYEDSTDISPYEGLRALPAGSFLEAAVSPEGKLVGKVNRYYDLRDRTRNLREQLSQSSMNALVQQSLDLLQSAVDLRLRSDVPVGLSLSGGLDSSTVAALMCKRQFSPVGFTFGSPKDLESEGPVVREIAESKKIQVNYIWPAPREMADAFWECLEAQDSPFTGGSIIAQYLVFKAARAHGFKVLLGGQGGDEAFMGYRKFLLFRLQNLRANRNYLQTGRTLFDLIPVFFSELRSARDYFLAAKRYRSKEGIRESLRFPEIKPISMGYEGREPLWIRQMHDVLDFSLPTLLRYEDRNSMGNSIESRLPFMDYRTIEFGLALPEALKVQRGFCKWIVREAVQGLVPDSIRVARYKKAFNVNQKEWMKEGLGQSLRQMLHEREASIRDFLPKTMGGIDEAFSDQQLISRPNAFREAVALVWLAKRI